MATGNPQYPTMATATESVKEQVVDTVPKQIKELRFGIAYVNLNTSQEAYLTISVRRKILSNKASSKSAIETSTIYPEIERQPIMAL